MSSRQRRPTSAGWQARAGAPGSLQPDPPPVLTASEIGSFTFCKQAWYLQRRGVTLAPEAELRLSVGAATHRAIGRRADRAQAAGVGRRLALAAIVVLPALLVLVLARWQP